MKCQDCKERAATTRITYSVLATDGGKKLQTKNVCDECVKPYENPAIIRAELPQ